MKKEIFREYDIRGIYNEELFDDDAYLIGKSYGSFIQEKYQQTVCIVGQDNRLSSPKLYQYLTKGLLDSGISIIDLGICTTPMFSYACLKTNVIFGIMITASHNPKDYNGFKFTFDNLGFARGKQVYDFLDFTLKGNFLEGKGKITKLDIYPHYKFCIKNNIDLTNKNIKVVIDPGNGTTSFFAKEIYNMFNSLDIIMINDISDATFPNHHPDPNVKENLEQLRNKVLEVKADIGIAFDGDGDRVGIVDNEGNIVSTEYLMILIIRDLIKKIDNKTFLFDIKCSKVLEDEILKLGGTPLCYKTGASYTRYKTNKEHLIFGGEYSGHLYFNDKWLGFDSGIYNGLRIVEILSNCNKKLSEMFGDVSKYVITPEIKIPASDSKKFTIVQHLKNEYLNSGYKINDIDGIKVDYNNGWVLVRASNTTPNLTIRIEADTKENQIKISNHFTNILKKYLD